MDPFVEEHRPQWERLDSLLKTIATSGLRALSAAQIEDLGRLYRQAATHLAQARAEGRDPRVIQHLNLLVGRAHAVIYRRRRRRSLRIGRFYAVEFPRVFRRTSRFTLAATLLSVAGACLAHFLAVSDPAWLDHVCPQSDQMEQAIGGFLDRDEPAGEYFADTQKAIGGSGGFSSFLWTHNLQVSVFAFGLGFSAGIGTVFVLLQNGMMVGSVIAMGALRGKTAVVCAIIAPHGVLELSAIMMAGGAGLMLGYALINPGKLTRRDAIVIAARDAIQLMAGVALVLLLAGFIEGTLTPLSTGFMEHDVPRIIFGLATGVVLYGHLAVGDKVFGRMFGVAGVRTEEAA